MSYANLLHHLPTPSSFWSLRDTQGMEHQVLAALGFSVSVLLVLFITMANALLLKALWWKRRRSFTAAALVSMGCADMAQCIFAMPLVSFISLHVTMPFEACLMVVCGVVAWSLVSSFHHLLIAIHRWYAVAFPTRYQSMFTFRCATLQFASCWSFGVAIATIPLSGYNNLTILRAPPNGNTSSSSAMDTCSESGACCVSCSLEITLKLEYIVYVLFYLCVLMPLLITSTFYVMIFKKVKDTIGGRDAARSNESFYLKQKSMAKTMVLQVALVAITRLPFYLLNMLKFYCPWCSIPSWVLLVATVFVVLSASCNPFIYIFRDRKLQSALSNTLVRNRVDTA
ncbi:adenosine receptor A1-like [Ambystoma mexicanum]|uniref:adenosine receptor A1-like n=1 Tax=Ambystoma mexicanum TaxID=8296 RepID=UPI0037E781CE